MQQDPRQSSGQPIEVDLSNVVHTERIQRPQTIPANPEPATSPDFVPLELPSNFIPYSFKTLHLGRIKGIHQAKIARAGKHQSTRMVVEAVDSLLQGASAFDLTPSDFRWLLYRLLKENYVKSPRLITAFCSNPDHVEKVANGEMSPQTLQNIGSLNNSLLNEYAFDYSKIEKLLAENEYLQQMKLGYATMRETLEAVEKDDEEFQWLAELAMCLAPQQTEGQPPLNLAQRVELVGTFDPDQTEALAQYAELTSDYGIEEVIRMRCVECGAEILEPFQPSASMFL